MSDELESWKLRIKRFCEEREWDQYHGPKELAIGLVTESTELLELFRYTSESEAIERVTHNQAREKVADELADVFFTLIRFSQKYDFDLFTALESKFKKIAIKYPVETSRGSNKKYTEL